MTHMVYLSDKSEEESLKNITVSSKPLKHQPHNYPTIQNPKIPDSYFVTYFYLSDLDRTKKTPLSHDTNNSPNSDNIN